MVYSVLFEEICVTHSFMYSVTYDKSRRDSMWVWTPALYQLSYAPIYTLLL